MTDYNDGKWHGWNGGECPVHPKSEIDVHYINAFGQHGRDETRVAKNHNWRIFCLFRVVKAYREPREWWLRLDANGDISGTDPVEGDPPPNWKPESTIRVREVTE